MAVYMSWKMLLAESNNGVRHHTATYNDRIIFGSFPWIYLNHCLQCSRSVEEELWRKACTVSCKNNHRYSIFAHMRHSLDNQKWASFYEGRNGNVNTLIQAQRISPCCVRSLHIFTLFLLQHQPCTHTQAVCCWQCPAAFHQRNGQLARCCLICLSVYYSLFQGCCCPVPSEKCLSCIS